MSFPCSSTLPAETKRGKYLSAAASPRLSERLCRGVKQGRGAQHVSPFIGKAGTGGAGTRRPGRRHSPAAEPLPRGSRGCPRRGPFLRPSPELQTTRETPSAGAGLSPTEPARPPHLGEGEWGLPPPPEAPQGLQLWAVFCSEAGGKGAETPSAARAHLFQGSLSQQTSAKPLHAKIKKKIFFNLFF